VPLVDSYAGQRAGFGAVSG